MERKFNPLAADHPAVTRGERCGICNRSFQAGDATTLIATQPADDAERQKMERQQGYVAEAGLVHWMCAHGETDE